MKVSENISLRALNSFGVEAQAHRLVEWNEPQELKNMDFTSKWMALGGGNNILFTHDFEGTLIKSAAQNIEITGEKAKTLSVKAEAGVNWDDFVSWCIEREAWGAENLSGIPGTVGAAPIQNIGAYGAEVKNIIDSVECWSIETSNSITLSSGHCDFGYRDSIFKRHLKDKVIVTAVYFTLSKKPRPNLQYTALADKVAQTGSGEPTLGNISQAVIAIRNNKLPDPRITGNAGSFFKNPIIPTTLARELAEKYPSMPFWLCEDPVKAKLAAGWLIDAAGWRGKVDPESDGRVGIHPQQALVIINKGSATGSQIASFAQKIQADVEAMFGVALQSEVNIE